MTEKTGTIEVYTTMRRADRAPFITMLIGDQTSAVLTPEDAAALAAMLIQAAANVAGDIRDYTTETDPSPSISDLVRASLDEEAARG